MNTLRCGLTVRFKVPRILSSTAEMVLPTAETTKVHVEAPPDGTVEECLQRSIQMVQSRIQECPQRGIQKV
jgi:hypothetical protein